MTLRFLFLLFTLFTLLPLRAQRYEEMWLSVERAIAADRPRTALETVERVRRRAIDENDEGQLLRADIIHFTLSEGLSPDSARTALDRLAAHTSGSRAARLLRRTALARLLERQWRDTAATTRMRDLLRATMADSTLDVLAGTDTRHFATLFREGRDSRMADFDLLSVLGTDYVTHYRLPAEQRCATALRLARYYELRGKADGAFYFRLLHATLLEHYAPRDEESPAVRALLGLVARADSGRCSAALAVEARIALIEAYDTPRDSARTRRLINIAQSGVKRYGGERRAEVLRTFIRRTEAPSAALQSDTHRGYPGIEVRALLTTRAVRRVELRLTRTDLTAIEADRPRTDIRALRRRAVAKPVTYTFPRPERPSYVYTRDSIRYTLPSRPGIYIADLVADGHVMDSRRIDITTLQPVIFRSRQNVAAKRHDDLTPDTPTRITAVDARTGQPVGGGTLLRIKDDDRRTDLRLPVPASGTVEIREKKADAAYTYYLTTEDDAAAPGFKIYASDYYGAAGPEVGQAIEIFTDRAIYRPGNRVEYSLVAHRHEGDRYAVWPELKPEVRLLDVNRREVGRQSLITDTMGVAAGTFTLPGVCLPGVFRIEARCGGLTASTEVRVEQYKQPALRVDLVPVTRPYVTGDTVSICGTALTMNGLPVEGARVRRTTRRTSWWRQPYYTDGTDGPAPETSESVTDAEGRFTLPVALTLTPAERESGRPLSFLYHTRIDVTAPTGETVTAAVTLRAGDRPTYLTAAWPDLLCRDSLPALTVQHTTMAGAALTDTLHYRIERDGNIVNRGRIAAARPFPAEVLRALPSGSYHLTATADDSSRTATTFTLFSESDTRPADATRPLWCHMRPSAAGDSLYVTAGTPLSEATLFFDLTGQNGTHRSARRTLSDTLLHFALAYDPAMGETQHLYIYMVRDGHLHRADGAVVRPRPDKRLRMEWITFRSRLTPGSEETWRLRVTRADGQPAAASVTARLYDASLDALARSEWAFRGIRFPRAGAFATLESADSYRGLWLNGQREVTVKACPPPSYTRWREDLFGTIHTGIRPQMYRSSIMLKEERTVVADAAVNTAAQKSTAAGGISESPAPLRSDFAETALFRPALRTDAEGRVTIDFRLPESLTTWRFTALAHTAEMDYGRMDTTITARKLLTVETALPRFVRRGDRAALPATVRNLTESAVRARVTFTLTDPLTERLLADETRIVELPAGGSRTVTFTYHAETDLPLAICRMTAATPGHTDGEERYLPLLSDRTAVVRTLPFTLTRAGTHRLRIDTLTSGNGRRDTRITLQVNATPAWQAVAALPALAGTEPLSATEWGERLYALTLADHVARNVPELRRQTAALDTVTLPPLDRWAEETPWLEQMRSEREQTAALKSLLDTTLYTLRHTAALDALRALQDGNGAWSWYRGMNGNRDITLRVALLLARMERLTGDRSTHAMAERAANYLAALTKGEVEEMKKAETPVLADRHAAYLYLRSLMGMRPDATARYLLDAVERHPAALSLQSKGYAVIALRAAGRERAAEQMLRSLMEYTVIAPNGERYFDSRRAESGTAAGRIPAQTAAIEALTGSKLSNEDVVNEMRLWLLQCKRTQMWPTASYTADAVYALLCPARSDTAFITLTPLTDVTVTVEGRGGNTAAPAPNAAGGLSLTLTGRDAERARSVRLDVPRNRAIWGAVTAAYTLPAAEVTATEGDLSLTRRFEVVRGHKGVALTDKERLQPGDRIRCIYTVTARRDFDFVSLRAARAACLEPAAPLSGFAATAGLSAYRVVRDASTEYFFERIPKGEHTFAEEMFVDRNGRYSIGIARLGGVYAPEYEAHTGETIMTVTE